MYIKCNNIFNDMSYVILALQICLERDNLLDNVVHSDSLRNTREAMGKTLYNTKVLMLGSHPSW